MAKVVKKRIKSSIVSKVKIIIVCFMLIILVSFMSNTFSKYASSTDGDLNISFAKWQILVNDKDISEAENSEMLFVPVIEKNDNVDENSVAPSSKGYFDISIDPSNVAMSFNYNISFKIENEDIPDLMVTKYAIVPNTYIDGDTLDIKSLDSDSISKDMIYDVSKPFTPFTVRLFFEWYDGEDNIMNDEEDSNIGSVAAINDSKFMMKANVSFTQIKKN